MAKHSTRIVMKILFSLIKSLRKQPEYIWPAIHLHIALMKSGNSTPGSTCGTIDSESYRNSSAKLNSYQASIQARLQGAHQGSIS